MAKMSQVKNMIVNPTMMMLMTPRAREPGVISDALETITPRASKSRALTSRMAMICGR